MYTIKPLNKDSYHTVVSIWEDSVRATHHFLTEEDIQLFKSLIPNSFLPVVQLFGAFNEQDELLGFIGIAEQKIEMLFIHPSAAGNGIGKTLAGYTINELGVTKVDVNEQNPQAIGFYKHLGFRIIDRSDVDGLGKPYPLLMMTL
jgi:putative acetyltransferase